MYSPAAMERAPATRPATAASKTAAWVGSAEATPTTKLLVEMRPSLAPSVAARNQPIRSLRCNSPSRVFLGNDDKRMPPNVQAFSLPWPMRIAHRSPGRDREAHIAP